MPQLRKRKTKENIQEEIKKEKKDSDVSKSASQKKELQIISATSKTKTRKTSVKRKKDVSPLCSDEESNNKITKNKKAAKEKSPFYKKDLKPKKDTNDQSIYIKDELSSLDSDEESNNKIIKGKKSLKKQSFNKKNLKLVKKEIKDQDVSIKEEPVDSSSFSFHNSTDSGISSENLSDIIKETLLKSEPCSSFSKGCKQNKDDSSGSESEWEEVEENNETNSLDDYKPEIPKEGVEITIDCPELRTKRRQKKAFDEREWVRLYINRMRKDNQLCIHKTHLLCLLAHGIYVNKILNSDTIRSLALSLIPNDMFSFTAGKKVDKIDVDGIEKVVSWFRNAFSFENKKCVFLNLFTSLVKSFESTVALNASEYNLMFVVFARILGFKVRYCVSLYPVTYKASNLLKKPTSKKNSKKSECPDDPEKANDENSGTKKLCSKKSNEAKSEEKLKKLKAKKEKKISKTSKQMKEKPSRSRKKNDAEDVVKISRPRRSTGKNYKFSSDDEDDSDDKDFEIGDGSSDEDLKELPKMKAKQKRESCSKTPNRKVLSSDSEPPSPQLSNFDSENIICWTEIYSKPNKSWISIECANNIIDKPYDIERLAPKPVTYILAYDNESFVKDVTRRYCSEYMTATIKLRVDPDWWEETLEPFLPPNSMQNKAEEKKLDEMLVNKPLPTTIQG